jgi:hypothetical protein
MPQKAQYDPGNLPVITVIGHTVVTISRSGSGGDLAFVDHPTEKETLGSMTG